VRCLTAGECDGDVPHRRIGLRAMPMAFTRLDVHDITDINFAPFMLGVNHAGTGGFRRDASDRSVEDGRVAGPERSPARI
jgi:hypothetical protein